MTAVRPPTANHTANAADTANATDATDTANTAGTADTPSGAGVVDVCAMQTDADGWRAYLRRLAEEAPAYLRMFATPLCHAFDADESTYRRSLEEGRLAQAVELLVAGLPAEVDLDACLADLDTQGIGYQVLHGVPEEYADGSGVNDTLAALAARAPHRLQAWLGLSLRDPDRAVAEVESCPRRGLRGITVNPFLDGTGPLEERNAPVFAAAERLGLPVWLHTGQHFVAERPLDICSWWHVDRLAGRHPELPILVGHAGWPWVRELVAVAQRHRRVRLEISSHRPSQMSARGSGWEPLLAAGAGSIRRKVLFGSCAWVHRVPLGKLADEVRELGLGEAATEDWLSQNARRLLKLPRHHSPA